VDEYLCGILLCKTFFKWTLHSENYTEKNTEMSAVIDAVNNISEWTFLEAK
jgi:hypothetical protein